MKTDSTFNRATMFAIAAAAAWLTPASADAARARSPWDIPQTTPTISLLAPEGAARTMALLNDPTIEFAAARQAAAKQPEVVRDARPWCREERRHA